MSKPYFAEKVQVLDPGVDRILLTIPGARAAEMVERGQAKLLSSKRAARHRVIRLAQSLSLEKCKPAAKHGLRAYMGQKYTYEEPVRDGSGKVFSHLIQLRTDFLDREDSLAWLFRLSVLQNLSDSPDREWEQRVSSGVTQPTANTASV